MEMILTTMPTWTHESPTRRTRRVSRTCVSEGGALLSVGSNGGLLPIRQHERAKDLPAMARQVTATVTRRVHAAQKGKLRRPSKQVAQIAKTIDPADATDFAKTKHKGLPEKKPENKKPENKKLEKVAGHLLPQEGFKGVSGANDCLREGRVKSGSEGLLARLMGQGSSVNAPVQAEAEAEKAVFREKAASVMDGFDTVDQATPNDGVMESVHPPQVVPSPQPTCLQVSNAQRFAKAAVDRAMTTLRVGGDWAIYCTEPLQSKDGPGELAKAAQPQP